MESAEFGESPNHFFEMSETSWFTIQTTSDDIFMFYETILVYLVHASENSIHY